MRWLKDRTVFPGRSHLPIWMGYVPWFKGGDSESHGSIPEDEKIDLKALEQARIGTYKLYMEANFHYIFANKIY